jgi:hypothetical protein
MTTTRTPRFATWLLRSFGSSAHIESIVGDLAERYNRNRSASWYWRQALAAIALLAIKDIRRHKLLTIRSLMIGWAVVLTGYGPLYLVVKRFYTFQRVRPLLGTPNSLQEFDRQFWIFLMGALMLMLLGNLVIGTLSGWLVARFHRAIGKASVLLLTTSVIVSGLALFPRFYYSTITPKLTGCLGDAACRLTPLTIEWGTVLIWASVAVSVLYGGLLANRSRDPL